MWVISGIGLIRELDIGDWQAFGRCGDLSAFQVCFMFSTLAMEIAIPHLLEADMLLLAAFVVTTHWISSPFKKKNYNHCTDS